MMIDPLLILALAATANGGATVLPARFEAGRVYVVPQTEDGRTLRLFTDSGGGLFILESATKRFGLHEEVAPKSADDSSPPTKLVALPRFKQGLGIPAPNRNGGKLAAIPAEQAGNAGIDFGDGILGEAWFGGHVWTWDYPGRRLVLEAADWKPPRAATRVALGFRTGKDGARETDFPRITIRVDGAPIDVLLDTGATTVLSPEALKAVDDGLPALRATSMIADSTFQAWRKAHPQWRVIDKAQSFSGASMIEVPAVEIAGTTVGPVWFTWRPDKNFHEFMSNFMDRRVEGAIGGNALGHFVMTIDYPGAAAYFRCTDGCGVTPPPAP